MVGISRRTRASLGVGVLVALAVAVAWAGQPAGVASPTLTAPVTEMLNARRVYRDVGARLDPPRAGQRARIGSGEALERFRGSGILPGIEQQARGPTRITLVNFSDDMRGTWDATGPIRLEIQNVLAWVITLPGVPVNVHPPAPKPGQALTPRPVFRADLHIVVDATTGTVIEAFQTGTAPTG